MNGKAKMAMGRSGARLGLGWLQARRGMPEVQEQTAGWKMPSEVRLPDIALPRFIPGSVNRFDVQLPNVTLPRFVGGTMAGNQTSETAEKVKQAAEKAQPKARRRRSGGGLGGAVRFGAMSLACIAIFKEMSQPEERRQWHGRVLGVPYDFRPPTSQRLKDAFWNERAGLLTPMAWGLGWNLNLYRATRMVRDFAQSGTAPWNDRRPGSAAASPRGNAASEAQKQREDIVNRASIDSFPASDPPAF